MDEEKGEEEDGAGSLVLRAGVKVDETVGLQGGRLSLMMVVVEVVVVVVVVMLAPVTRSHPLVKDLEVHETVILDLLFGSNRSTNKYILTFTHQVVFLFDPRLADKRALAALR